MTDRHTDKAIHRGTPLLKISICFLNSYIRDMLSKNIEWEGGNWLSMFHLFWLDMLQMKERFMKQHSLHQYVTSHLKYRKTQSVCRPIFWRGTWKEEREASSSQSVFLKMLLLKEGFMQLWNCKYIPHINVLPRFN